MDWTTYLTDEPMKKYQRKIPNGPINQFYELDKGDYIPGKNVSINSIHGRCIFMNHNQKLLITICDLSKNL